MNPAVHNLFTDLLLSQFYSIEHNHDNIHIYQTPTQCTCTACKQKIGTTRGIIGICNMTLHAFLLKFHNFCRKINLIQRVITILGKENMFMHLKPVIRILQTYAASKRTSLQGLDNIAADENDTFTRLEEMIEELHNKGSTYACLEETYSLNNQLRPITTGYPKGPQASADFNNHGVCNEIPAIKVSRKTE
ncbi:unnamed protein product [Mytilus edulis]|uniref:Uncharacterized protein n=1 Tax=Mytilus edulis TaxID=6550 RepID=A0A8S3TB38_MYTED|nr:unnamed protein product [Mytilus edulis]